MGSTNFEPPKHNIKLPTGFYNLNDQIKMVSVFCLEAFG